MTTVQYFCVLIFSAMYNLTASMTGSISGVRHKSTCLAARQACIAMKPACRPISLTSFCHCCVEAKCEVQKGDIVVDGLWDGAHRARVVDGKHEVTVFVASTFAWSEHLFIGLHGALCGTITT